MITLTIKEIQKITEICEEAKVESFTLDQESGSGIGSILTMSFDTFVADFPAKVIVELRGIKDW
jgi:hypothetical protein